MRTLLPVIAILIAFSSCSKYQYLVLSSDDTPYVNNKHFIVENDTFRVVYNFSGFEGPLQLSVINKSKGMMEIDWNRSFFITGQRSRPLVKPASKLEGEVTRDTEDSRSFSFAGEMKAQASKEYIPPATAVNKICGKVVSGRFINTETYKMRKEKVNVKGFRKKIRRLSLNSNESPVSFRVYLTLGVEGREQPVVIDRSFYMSELIATKVSPDDMPPSENNVVTLTKFTRVGGVLAGVGAVSMLVVLAYVAGATEGD